LARQIHYILREMYPEHQITPESIFDLIEEIDENTLIFAADRIADRNDLPRDEFAQKIYRELGVEYEKNWHDKSLFRMSLNGENIVFSNIQESN